MLKHSKTTDSTHSTSHHLRNLVNYRNAQPTEKLKDAYKKFLVRSMRKTQVIDVRDFL